MNYSRRLPKLLPTILFTVPTLSATIVTQRRAYRGHHVHEVTLSTHDTLSTLLVEIPNITIYLMSANTRFDGDLVN